MSSQKTLKVEKFEASNGIVFSPEEIQRLIYDPAVEVQAFKKRKVEELRKAEIKDAHTQLFRALIELSRLYPPIFVKAILNMDLFDYQIEFMLALPHYRRLLINAGRQVGKTTVVAYSILWMLVTHPIMQRKVGSMMFEEPALYISVAPSYQQAQNIFSKVVNFIHQNEVFKELFIRQIKRSSSREEIITTVGSRYLSRSASGKTGPDVLRGFTAKGVVIDEAAFLPRLDLVLSDILEPMTSTTDGWIILISSPNTREDIFWKIYTGEWPGSEEWYRVRWTTDMNPLARAFFERKKRELGPEHPTFLREYLALPAETATHVFPISKIEKLRRPRLFAEDEYDAYAFGLDLGENISYSSLTIVGYKDDARLAEIIENVIWPLGTPIPAVLEDTLKYIEKYASFEKLVLGYYDEGSIGAVVNQIRPEITLWMQGFKITNKTRLELIALLRSYLDEEKLTIPPETGELVKELNMMTWVKRGQTVRPDHPPGGHDDAIMSTALALRALADAGFIPFEEKKVENEKKVLQEMTASVLSSKAYK